MLTLAPDAKAAWVAFHDAIESELGTGRELYDVRDVASKTADNAARLSNVNCPRLSHETYQSYLTRLEAHVLAMRGSESGAMIVFAEYEGDELL